MTRVSEFHDVLAKKLAKRSALDETDRAAIARLPFDIREYERHARIVREGGRASSCSLILSGFAIRSKTTASGARQIAALLVPCDFIHLQQIVLPRADHDVEALSTLRVAEIAAGRLLDLAYARPAICRAIWIDTLIEGSIARELLLNNSRRDGVQRVAHVLCEFAYRLGPGREPADSFEMPLTQEQLGDMTGLTGVHVNRTLRMLRERGLVGQSGRRVIIGDWAGLTRLAGFSPDYLYLDGDARSRPLGDFGRGRPQSGSRNPSHGIA